MSFTPVRNRASDSSTIIDLPIDPKMRSSPVIRLSSQDEGLTLEHKGKHERHGMAVSIIMNALHEAIVVLAGDIEARAIDFDEVEGEQDAKLLATHRETEKLINLVSDTAEGMKWELMATAFSHPQPVRDENFVHAIKLRINILRGRNKTSLADLTKMLANDAGKRKRGREPREILDISNEIPPAQRRKLNGKQRKVFNSPEYGSSKATVIPWTPPPVNRVSLPHSSLKKPVDMSKMELENELKDRGLGYKIHDNTKLDLQWRLKAARLDAHYEAIARWCDDLSRDEMIKAMNLKYFHPTGVNVEPLIRLKGVLYDNPDRHQRFIQHVNALNSKLPMRGSVMPNLDPKQAPRKSGAVEGAAKDPLEARRIHVSKLPACYGREDVRKMFHRKAGIEKLEFVQRTSIDGVFLVDFLDAADAKLAKKSMDWTMEINPETGGHQLMRLQYEEKRRFEEDYVPVTLVRSNTPPLFSRTVIGTPQPLYQGNRHGKSKAPPSFEMSAFEMDEMPSDAEALRGLEVMSDGGDTDIMD